MTRQQVALNSVTDVFWQGLLLAEGHALVSSSPNIGTGMSEGIRKAPKNEVSVRLIDGHEGNANV